MQDVEHSVLLIDDSPDYLVSYSRFLAGVGLKTVTAENCAEARRIFKPGLFACALVDLSLPDGKGTDLISEFSKKDPFLVSVVITGDLSAESVIGTMREGAFDYLTKPCSGAVLKHAVNRALVHHDAIRQRASLTQQLLEEREHLKLKVEQATKDLVAHVAMCEANNAQLSTLLRLTLISSTGMETEEDLMMSVFSEISKFARIVCLATQDGQEGQFMASYRGEDEEMTFFNVNFSGVSSSESTSPPASAVEDAIIEAISTQAHINPEHFATRFFPRTLVGGTVTMVCMLFDAQRPPESSLNEFLEMCAHHLATELEMSRLLQHTARYASVGRIAIDLSKNIIKGLSAIQLSGDVLGEMVDTEEARSLLRIIPQNVTELRDQIRQFQNIAQSKKDTLETVRLDGLIEQSLVILSGTAHQYGVEIVREFNVECECTLLNGTALQRTFLEILSVALRRLTHGGRIILRLNNKGNALIKFDMALEPRNDEALIDNSQAGTSLVSELEDRPGFLLYQRTIHACAGRITRETDSEGREVLSVILPRNAAKRHTLEPFS